MGRKAVVWVRCKSLEDMEHVQWLAVTGRLQRDELCAEPSETYSLSLDIEYTNFDDAALEKLKKLPGVDDAGVIEAPRQFTKSPETTRSHLLAKLSGAAAVF
ncbi:MAG: hypothetical protein A2845_02055 [Candidatus Lloydbacteria bacterium RIFCSPHIGHO2_01_FULL_49_22]|uniref:Uncharacterized protein n=1 Tax=Candidatus Lloydbacteria bacterium RIFCSPHIGHO2_01_FULL_49_22 TaxID=1798658 RepID=A0A1G2CY15_9BACT|nr:MAG: hypothetical protein A2845_02055 [Candidatus Lloydbacteria bacterium RIFCSPHIGHO2_01_FULL_49_22]